MAKIALISKSITPQVLGLAQALKFHRHDIIIITSHNEMVPDNLGYPVLTYFKKWNALEALKFFPRILGQAPDVWHFVYSDAHDRPKMADLALSGLAKALPGRVVASTFYDSLFQLPLRRLTFFVKSCDIVTTATRENLMYLKRQGCLARFAETEVLPPFILKHGPEDESDSKEDSDLKKMTASIRPYLVFPNEHLPIQNWKQVTKTHNVVICGPRPEKKIKQLGFEDLPKGIYFVGSHLTESQMKQLVKYSQAVVSGLDDFSVVELLNLHRICFESKTPIIGNARQAEALPGFCVHKRNGFLLDQSPNSFVDLLRQNEDLKIDQPLFHPLKSEIADSALNELNRLYIKIHQNKTSPFDSKRSSLS